MKEHKRKLDTLERLAKGDKGARVVVVWNEDDMPKPKPGERVKVITWEDIED